MHSGQGTEATAWSLACLQTLQWPQLTIFSFPSLVEILELSGSWQSPSSFISLQVSERCWENEMWCKEINQWQIKKGHLLQRQVRGWWWTDHLRGKLGEHVLQMVRPHEERILSYYVTSESCLYAGPLGLNADILAPQRPLHFKNLAVRTDFSRIGMQVS